MHEAHAGALALALALAHVPVDMNERDVEEIVVDERQHGADLLRDRGLGIRSLRLGVPGRLEQLRRDPVGLLREHLGRWRITTKLKSFLLTITAQFIRVSSWHTPSINQSFNRSIDTCRRSGTSSAMISSSALLMNISSSTLGSKIWSYVASGYRSTLMMSRSSSLSLSLFVCLTGSLSVSRARYLALERLALGREERVHRVVQHLLLLLEQLLLALQVDGTTRTRTYAKYERPRGLALVLLLVSATYPGAVLLLVVGQRLCVRAQRQAVRTPSPPSPRVRAHYHRRARSS